MERLPPSEKPRIATPEPTFSEPNERGEFIIRLEHLGAMEVRIDEDNPAHIDIEFVRVSPAQRNRGVGRKLHEILIERALQNGVRRISSAIISAKELRLLTSVLPPDAEMRVYLDANKEVPSTLGLEDICMFIDQQQALLNFYNSNDIEPPEGFDSGVYVEIDLSGDQEPPE